MPSERARDRRERLERRERLTAARLYLCTDARAASGDLEPFLDAVLAAGVDAVQLREKGIEARPEIALAELVGRTARRHRRLWSVNDRADVAWVTDPDILHLGQDDLPVPAARALLGPDVLIGRSTHTREQVEAAAVEPGVDYFCVGPTWPTPTKPGRSAPGTGLLRYAATVAPPDQAGARPWFAIGGIDPDNLEAVLAAGARRVVVVRAITEAEDPAAAAGEFAARLAAAAR